MSNATSTSPTLFAALTRRPSKESREAQQAAAKAARRQVLELVRNDWTYEPSSSPSRSGSPPQSGVAFDSDVVEWRAREEEDTSCSEAEGTNRAKGKPNESDPYRFENPDAVAQGLIERKARRRRRMQEEMQWNEGLRLWMSRRDAWTGAKVPSSSSTRQEDVTTTTTSDESAAGSSNDDDDNDSTDIIAKSSSPPTNTNEDSDSDEAEVLIPIVQPNSLYGTYARTPVNPSAYSTIYSRLIVQSNAPTMPLNLKHVTRALVHGWKANGEWPPKPTPRNDIIVRKKGSTAAAEGHRNGNGNGTQEVNGGGHRTRRSGSLSETMKKMFHLRPGRRFHLRGHSRDGEGQVPEA